MKMTQKDLQTLLDLGAATELTDENCNDYDFWYNVVCRVYRADGSLYGKVLVVASYEKRELAGRWFIVRGDLACCY